MSRVLKELSKKLKDINKDKKEVASALHGKIK